MRRSALTAAAITAATLAVAGGCGDQPRYEDQRPPTDSLVYGNTGIQAKDVGAATDQMAASLLGCSALNASPHQWTIVLTPGQFNTADPAVSYDVFTTRLKARLAQMGQGRVALIENMGTYHKLQNEELEHPGDAYGQAGGGNAAGVQPDYALYIEINEMPNRATDYYLITGKMVGLQTRQIVWQSAPYEFQSAR